MRLGKKLAFLKRLYLLTFNIICLISFTCGLYGQSDKQINNLTAFAKLYGYVRFFYPSDESANLNWDRFAIHGAKQVENCTTNKDLLSKLNELFKPFAPAIVIEYKNDNKSICIYPNDRKTKRYGVVAWQHLGIFLGDTNNLYRSKRTNRPFGSDFLFPEFAKIGENVEKNLNDDIKAVVPLALYGTNNQTYPSGDKLLLEALKKKLISIPDSTLNGRNIYTRLGDIIILWNIFQHFYPYFDVTSTNWLQDLKEAFADAYSNKTSDDFRICILKLTAKLKDGHIHVDFLNNSQLYYPSFLWEWVQESLVITNVGDTSIPLKKGDIVTKINGEGANEFFKNLSQYISSATERYLYFRALFEALIGEKDSEINLEVLHAGLKKQVQIKRTMSPFDFLKMVAKKDTLIRFKDGITYINLTLAPMDYLERVMPLFQKSRVIICDLRGYPNRNKEFIAHLLKRDDTAKEWMQIPEIIFPDHENIVGFRKLGWQLKQKDPHLNAKIIFLINVECISYCESYLSLIDHYKLATLIGEPTAGTNGNINPFSVPGGYTIWWTGMKVVKQDGTQFHGIGILPDIYVHKTIAGLIENRDEILDKALEIAETIMQ